jgi:kynurenine 3-monooxygenase
VRPFGIVGAGPAGTLLALFLEQQGFGPIDLYESRPDPREQGADSGRSINLALAARGIHALKRAGVFDQLGTSLLPMRARCIHPLNGASYLQPYGQRPEEVNYSISRHRLNQRLIEVAAARPSIRFHFKHRLESANFDRGIAKVRDLKRDIELEVAMNPLVAADGAGSRMRRELSACGLIRAVERDLEHGYKELTIPPGTRGEFQLAPEALHIWPRGNFMLIALPNEDGSFTATLFLPKAGAVSFESLGRGEAAVNFMRQHFPDALALMPHASQELAQHPLGFLGSVDAAPWHHLGQTLLVGDAAHAMVPFHGQGMNCAFEDCLLLSEALSRGEEYATVFGRFSQERKIDTDAITAMALENYQEMRERVADPKFQLQQEVALALERRLPERFIPRYSMVMHHHEVPYHVALERGRIQSELLSELTAGETKTLEQVDFGRAAELVRQRLAPLR